jgi:hypothetical protein
MASADGTSVLDALGADSPRVPTPGNNFQFDNISKLNKNNTF